MHGTYILYIAYPLYYAFDRPCPRCQPVREQSIRGILSRDDLSQELYTHNIAKRNFRSVREVLKSKIYDSCN